MSSTRSQADAGAGEGDPEVAKLLEDAAAELSKFCEIYRPEGL